MENVCSWTTFGAALTSQRIEVGFSIADLAECLGVVPASVERWEQGLRPRTTNLRGLLDLFPSLRGFAPPDAEFTGSLAERLKRLMQRRRLSKQQLAERVGVSAWTVYQWCRGSWPSEASWIQLLREYPELRGSKLPHRVAATASSPSTAATDNDRAGLLESLVLIAKSGVVQPVVEVAEAIERGECAPRLVIQTLTSFASDRKRG